MTCYVLRIVFAALGLLGGPLGVAFGFVLGYLLDTIAAEWLLARVVRRAIAHSTPPRKRKLNLPILAARLAVTTVYAGRLTTEEREQCVDTIWSFSGERLLRRHVDRIVGGALLAAQQQPDTGPCDFSRLCDYEERETALQVCGILAVGENRCSVLHAVARALLLPSAVAERYLRRAILDPESCTVLGVGPAAEWGEIRSAYRTLAAQLHPDTMADVTQRQQEEAERAFVRVQTAYETLRAQLDAAARPSNSPA